MPFASWFSCSTLWSMVRTPRRDFIDELPNDILHKIFIKLPAKSIGHCMCVQKRWRSLLKSPSFLSLYNNNNNKNKSGKNQYLIIWKNDSQLEVRLDNRNMDYLKLYTLPVNKVYNFPDENCIAICNGLICFAKDPSHFVLWNPFIKKTLALPETIVMPNRPAKYRHHIGFAFDSLANDYKVIRILVYGNDIQSHVEIFSMNHNSWKFGFQIDHNYYFVEQSPPATNGSLYFIVKRYMNATYTCVILEFNLNTESFRQIKLPEVFEERISKKKFKKLAVDKDSLLVLFTLHLDDFCDIDIWVMKEHGNAESWSRIWKFKGIGWYNLYGLTNLNTMSNDPSFDEDIKRKWLQRFSEPHDRMISEITTETDLYYVSVRNVIIRHVFRPFEESLILLDNKNALDDEYFG